MTGQPEQQQRTRTRRQPTLRAVRLKCLDCLNRDRIGFDCGIDDCPLYKWQPWKGRPEPKR